MAGRTFVPSWQLSRKPVRYVIEGMIPETGVGILYGPSTAGKSLVALKMGLDLVNGAPFFGYETVKGDVVMCLGEGAADAGIRLEALIAKSVHEEPADDCSGNCTGTECRCTKTVWLEEEGLFYVKRPFALWDEGERRAAIAKFRSVGPNLRMVVFDTLTLFARGKSLEWPTPASQIMSYLKDMAEELGCFVLAVHHTNKDGKKMRGAQVLFDEADVVIRVSDGTITNEKQKTGSLFDPIPYEIEVVWWTDEETGERVQTALVHEEVEEEPPERTAPQENGRSIPLLNVVPPAREKPAATARNWSRAQVLGGKVMLALLFFGVPAARYYHILH